MSKNEQAVSANDTPRRLHTWERWAVVMMLLLAWGLRWIALLDVPPGWRDDDLIELYTFSWEILESGPQIYFSGASGHEPLYHTLRAPLLALAGLNQAAARWLSAVCGTLAALLTWAVGRRLFTREVGALAGATVAVSFWGLMYSRVAIRHIGVLPWALLAIYSAWRVLQDEQPPHAAAFGIAIGTAGGLYTYYAGRIVPALLIVALDKSIFDAAAKAEGALETVSGGAGGRDAPGRADVLGCVTHPRCRRARGRVGCAADGARGGQHPASRADYLDHARHGARQRRSRMAV